MSDISASPTDRVQSLIEITQSLSTIFAQENTLLESHRPREMAPLQAEKARLAAAYAKSIRDIATNRSLVDGAGDELLSTLKDITRTFEERAAHQKSLLDGASKASEGLVKAIAAEAHAAQSQPTYKGNANNQPVTTPAAVCLDKTA